MIFLDESICTDPLQASSREWLETNGIGGFACGTISGEHTRRYHGLLTAATLPPLGRILTLSKFEEVLKIDGREFELSTDRYRNAVSPEGYKDLKSFRLDPFPIWTFVIDGVEIEKRFFLINGQNTAVCRWRVTSNAASECNISLVIRPLVAFRDYHSLQHKNDDIDTRFDSADGVVTIKPYQDLPALYFYHSQAKVEPSGFWYYDFEYLIEKERGFDFHEDLYQPFELVFDLAQAASIIVSTETAAPAEFESNEKSETERRRKLADDGDKFRSQLKIAADQFVVQRGTGNTIIAGYPWFSDWGRDTMIALSGLTLSTGRYEIAKNILAEFAKHFSRGMLPNRFPDHAGDAEYNTVDATLWYFEAARAYAAASGDEDFIRDNIYERLTDVIAWHMKGTRYDIHVDTDGLLYAGRPDVQLTWMDAKVGNDVITPRTGKAVEIQALWYSALCIMSDFADRFDDTDGRERYAAMADLCRQNFNASFWNESEKCLFDVIDGENRDASVRPNQIIAVSLGHSMPDAERCRAIVEKAEKELLTPVGLRSLSPRDPKYVPVYIGSPEKRDSSYHQGTVWAWLIGPFIDAYRKVHKDEPDLEARIGEMLFGFRSHILEAGLGQITEIFDGDAPHHPRGCFAQAWSVAEVLRVLCTDKTN